jgi:type VI secretion system protein ImpL
METACHLQDLWEKEVLAEVQGVSDQESLHRLLLGGEGYCTKFITGPIAPFVSRGLQKGYYAKEVLGERIPFENSFLSFITKGAKSVKAVRDNYKVSIRGLPTDTNRGAKIRVHATRLEVQCANEAITLHNLNYPVSRTFSWSPQDCGDVVFQISVGNLTLTKKYTGYQGFPRFLDDFRTGQHTFYPGDFPKEKAALDRLGIRHIKAKYEFEGHQPILRLLVSEPGIVPSTIVTCWDQ